MALVNQNPFKFGRSATIRMVAVISPNRSDEKHENVSAVWKIIKWWLY
jgi:hypothetical protein